MSIQPGISRTATLVRRTTVLLAGSVALVAVAGPASADVAEGWSTPDDVDAWHALLVLGGIPLALGLLITALVYVPALVRGERVAPNAPAVENQWIGGPRRTTAELAGPDGDESQAGGASARW
ncbi:MULTISPECIES: hypothetical protein [Nocardioides]|uniref:Uncharacterized protein n=1 Tax=Nocardioides lianchengensis TaxID=1045774 RepID=A0A1G6UKH1_9ACTN|nr:hypothetical protein [Nocardioides lianchengensis]NYG10961.1 hypothetical protein [Nocardioides lianchengensis]SDD41754.1 hypothetical protein SAMN05421872_10811 [Nocardioides lianchengensis]